MCVEADVSGGGLNDKKEEWSKIMDKNSDAKQGVPDLASYLK